MCLPRVLCLLFPFHSNFSVDTVLQFVLHGKISTDNYDKYSLLCSTYIEHQHQQLCLNLQGVCDSKHKHYNFLQKH